MNKQRETRVREACLIGAGDAKIYAEMVKEGWTLDAATANGMQDVIMYFSREIEDQPYR